MQPQGSLDKLTYLKIDHALVAEFLSGHANALMTAKLIGQKEVDNLRIALSAQNTPNLNNMGTTSSPLLLSLFEQNHEFVKTLAFLYGSRRLSLNLMRYILPNYLEHMQETLTNWIHNVSKKAELYFNQNLYFFDGSVCEKQSLCSTVLLEFAEILANEKAYICQQAEYLKTFYEQPTTLVHQHLDAAIAANLGFIGTINPDEYLGVPDEKHFSAIGSSLSRIVAASRKLIATVLEPYSANPTAVFNFGMFINLLESDSERLQKFILPQSTSHTAWEVFRHNTLNAWADAGRRLTDVAQQFEKTLQLRVPAKQHIYPLATQRNVLQQLMAHGLHLGTALTCCRQLFEYLQENNTRLFEILPGELTRISKDFPASVLETIATWDKLDFEQSLTDQKSHNLERIKNIGATVASTALVAILLVGSSFMQTGCGLKLDPKSSLPDLRPSIPFSEPVAKPDEPTENRQDEQKEGGNHNE